MKFNPKFVYSVREVITFRELIETSVERCAHNEAFLYRNGDGVVTVTYEQYLDQIKALATYLNSKGYQGKKIAVTGKNSYNWALTYMAVACGVGVIVPLDKDLPYDEAEYILKDSGSACVMVSEEIEEKLENLNICDKLYMKDIPQYIAEGKKLMQNGDTSYAEHTIDPNGLGILLYTSGTTGVAKGVMLSQRNICADIIGICRYVNLYPTDRTLSVLPLHHTYECTIGFIAFLYGGASIAYNDSLRYLKSDLQLFKPTIFIAVPMILESFLKVVKDKYNSIPGGNAVFALQKAASKMLAENEQAKKKLFKVVNQAFGGRLRLILCGAAPLAADVHKAYESFGIKVYIGYGLTETSPVSLMHNDFYRTWEDNGFPPADTFAKILDPDEYGRGELAVKGNNVMLGYYNMPEETERVLKDGWFRTGDLAQMCDNGAIKIIGRLKSMIVAKNGKKIFPEELEFKLLKNECIKECMVFATGDENNPVVTAAIYPERELVEKKLGIKFEDDPDMYAEQIKKYFTEYVGKLNASNVSYKAITKIIIREKEFEKTTTRKIKRNSSENTKENIE